jgi:hypothetical protein
MTFIRWPWEGEIVQVNEDGSWSFYRCAMCRQPLTTAIAKSLGYGSSCAKKHGIEKCERRVEAIRAEDRRRYRNRLDVVRILSRPGRIEDERSAR